MKVLVVLITTLIVQQACSQNVTLKIEGDLSNGSTYKLNLIDKLTKKKSKIYQVHGYMVSVKDTNNQDVIGLDGRKLSGTLFLRGDTLTKSDFNEVYWSKLPSGKYYLVFSTIVCENLKNKKDEGFSIPDQRIVIFKKE